MRIGHSSGALGLLLLVGTAASTFAAPTWTPPFTLPFTFQNGPQFGFATGGVQFLGHLELVTPVDLNNVMTRLVVSRTVPGGTPVEELVIESTPTAVPVEFALAVAPNGAAVVAYGEGTSSDFDPTGPPLRWRATYRSAQGVWEAPTTLFTDSVSGPGSGLSSGPLCAIAPDGTAAAGATHVEADDAPEPPPGQGDDRLDVAVRRANGSWEPSQRISPPNQSATVASLVVDDGANFTLAWSARTSEGATSGIGDDVRSYVLRRLLVGQSAWSPVETVSGGDVATPSIALGPSGSAVAAFQQDGDLWAATRVDSLHTFTAPQQLIPTAVNGFPRGVGVGPDGTAYVLYAFVASSSNDSHVGVVRRPSGGTWTDPTPVSSLARRTADGRVAFQGDDAILVWSSNDANDFGSPYLLQASRWPADAGTPEEPHDLEEVAELTSFQQVVADQSGGVLATWQHGVDIRGAVFDGGGPVLVASSIPAASTAGSAAAFSATFGDLWSALGGGPTWNFGDGTPAASGSTVQHTYAAPGTYTGSVRSTDALGNETVVPFAVAVGLEAIAPTLTISLPSCPDTLSAQACDRRRRRRRLWQTVRGAVSDAPPSSGIAAVELSVTIVAGKKTFVLNDGRFVRNGDPSVFTAAALEGAAWSLRLPKLRRGRFTITARSRDVAGNVSQPATIEVRLR